ncbi:hypothetical protein [Mesorhizobium sp.]|uniref:hypothetical protein n=1 Tax=Mesorhizobium sp. TaxID=1871066 RepID=UPI001213FF59|nr:hypothetical protein [Mesorhizobium sp.]TIN80348.1 MAG: hypothetical protein E5Y09_00405 [Mesorhizobium sp.]
MRQQKQVAARDTLSKYAKIASGFHFEGEGSLSQSVSSLLGSNEDLDVIAGVLLSCQNGDFSLLRRLSPILRRNDGYTVWTSCIHIVSYAGTWQDVKEFSRSISDIGNSDSEKHFQAVLFGNSNDRRAISDLLSLYFETNYVDTLSQIRAYISYQLESANDILFDGIEDPDDEEQPPSIEDRELYAKLVRDRFDEVTSRLPRSETPLFEGSEYNVLGVADSLRQQIEAGSEPDERLFRTKMIFEAATGADCSRFYDDIGRFNRLAAMATVEEFLDRDDMRHFQPGQRYFFGHPIPL